MKENESDTLTTPDNDIFVFIDDGTDLYDFVTIDVSPSAKPLLIDMSDFELCDISGDISDSSGSQDGFVTIDDSTTFVSDFNEDDLIIELPKY
jgi:hypothetical protein